MMLLKAMRIFAQVPHPPGTTRVDALPGSWDSCTATAITAIIFVAKLRTYNGDRDAINNFYQNPVLGVIFPE